MEQGVRGGVEDDVWKSYFGRKGLLTKAGGLLGLEGSMEATLLDREAKSSLTTDTMCQNLFDPIRLRA